MNSQPDFKAVAEKMKIVPGTAYYRYKQLKTYFENSGVTYGGAEKDPSTEGQGEPKTPKKTPRKSTKKSPKKVDDEDEEEHELKPVLEMEAVFIKKEEEQESKLEPAVKVEDDSDA